MRSSRPSAVVHSVRSTWRDTNVKARTMWSSASRPGICLKRISRTPKMKLDSYRRSGIRISLRIRTPMLTERAIWIWWWFTVMAAIFIQKSNSPRVRISQSSRLWTGLHKWHLPYCICMRGKSCIETWKLRIFSWRMAKLDLGTSVSPKCSTQQKTLRRHVLGHHTICRLSYSRINPTAISQMCGHSAASSTRCATYGMPSTLSQSTDSPWRSFAVVTPQ